MAELDFNILKAITSNKTKAVAFAREYDESMFSYELRENAKLVLDFIKSYKTTPSKRTLIARYAETPEQLNKIDSFWQDIDNHSYDDKDFEYDVGELKKRFKVKTVKKMKDTLEEKMSNGADPDTILKEMALNIQKTNVLNDGRSHVQKSAGDYIDEFKDRYESKKNSTVESPEILTGYSMIDSVTGGFSPSELIVIGGETNAGKLLTLDTPLPTPNGFVNMGDISPGDKVFGRDGKVCTVVSESNIEITNGWKFIFSDGSEVISHDNHEWLTFDRKEQVNLNKHTPEFRAKRRERRTSRAVKKTKPWLAEANKNRKYNLLPAPTGTIRTSKEIAETLYVGKGKSRRKNHAIPIAEAIELPEKDLIIDPYLFGYWLGDGTSAEGAITTMDPEIITAFEEKYKLLRKNTRTYKNGITSKASTYWFKDLRTDLTKLQVVKNKHIPHDYLWASKEQRLALLQGLMDSDGFASKNGSIDFVNTNKKIAYGAYQLVQSLGKRCTITKGEAKLYGKVTGPKWTVRFAFDKPAFRLKRKAERQRFISKNKFRYITEAIRVHNLPMKCIQVDSPDHLYLCTKHFIPTHNSMLLSNMSIQMWLQQNTIDTDKNDFKRGYSILYFSLEMPYEDCFDRFLARVADIPQRSIRDAKLNEEEIQRRDKALKFIKDYQEAGNYFNIVDVPRNVTIEEVELRFQDALLQFRPDVVVVDYMGLMHDPAKAKEQDWLKMGAIAASLHEFSRAYDCVMLTAVQLTDIKRGAKNKGDQEEHQKVGVHRIGRSSHIMHHVNIGIQIESRLNERSLEDMRYHVIKNRKGPLGQGNLIKNFECASLYDVPFIEDQNESGSISDKIPELIKRVRDQNEGK